MCVHVGARGHACFVSDGVPTARGGMFSQFVWTVYLCVSTRIHILPVDECVHVCVCVLMVLMHAVAEH